ncbi:MAG: response regulator [Geminocystis sp.]|nr:response regulator [Geminocystis sp.]HIK37092.1 response regulator [Geminocystis sp. M7585_C2015_104]MCS7148616.1 response regulator [Geminocystis sp.]MCX8079390.1 response regulator [Geminocystis sp.]MDW8114992.1 response regulator [Geminocystis sp.]
MTSNQEKSSNVIPFREFNAAKQAGFFENLKQPRFTGRLLFTGPKNVQWVFYLYLGRLVYATGGNHPVRRWRRNVIAYLPNMPSQMAAIQEELDQIQIQGEDDCWEYELLCFWVDKEKITLEQASKFVRSTIVEVLFDMTQAMQVSCQLKPDKDLPFPTRLVLLDAEQLIAEAQKLWHAWQAAKIADRSPDMAPVIAQPQELKQQTKPQVYQTLCQLLDGQHTLRDLSIRMKKDVVTVTRSLLPYVQRGFVRLVEIPDLPPPKISKPEAETVNQKITIACIDDSPLICQTMEKIITGAGYNFIGINDALRAIAILLSKKPDLIFLDLVMPNANGYEICSQLRKLTFFKNTPIVILTGNDGIVDRVRAKMVGSSDFLSKPIDANLVLETIRKHLKLGVTPPQA